MSILDDAYLSRHMKELPPEPLTNLHIGKPVPDSKEWWHDVAEGLGVTIQDLKAEIVALKASVPSAAPPHDLLRTKLTECIRYMRVNGTTSNVELIEEALAALASPAASHQNDTLEKWRMAALTKDRTRAAIRERLRAGEPEQDVADDYGVPLAFVSHLAQWQLFGDQSLDLVAHLSHQREWSDLTFGPGVRTAGVIDHIRKELREIEAKPHDLSEWIDVVILAFDGAGRAGYLADEIVAALAAKQAKNEAREWPDWRRQPIDKAIEHVKGLDETEESLEKMVPRHRPEPNA